MQTYILHSFLEMGRFCSFASYWIPFQLSRGHFTLQTQFFSCTYQASFVLPLLYSIHRSFRKLRVFLVITFYYFIYEPAHMIILHTAFQYFILFFPSKRHAWVLKHSLKETSTQDFLSQGTLYLQIIWEVATLSNNVFILYLKVVQREALAVPVCGRLKH